MRVDAGLIGGTGVGSRLAGLPGTPLHVPTELGTAHGRLVELGGKSVFAMSRHSAGHRVPPHRVNYAAMALALQKLGVRACFSTAAVGSLRAEWGPGTLVACDDFLDASGRHPTLFDGSVVHTDFSDPFPGRSWLVEAAKSQGVAIEERGVYVCAAGPRYETPAEIRAYGKLGGDVIGMTAATEAILMREAGVPYGCLAIVTNLASGLSPAPLSHEEVSEAMERAGAVAIRVLSAAIGVL